MVKAVSTYGIELHTSEDGVEYTKLVDIKTYPDIGGEPEMLESTTLSDSQETFIRGIDSGEAMEFQYNYTKANYAAVKALAGKAIHYKVIMGRGEEAQDFTFQGEHTTRIEGGGVNEVINAMITVAPSTEITVGN